MSSKTLFFDTTCPHCRAGANMVNTEWAECVSPYCEYPYSVNGVWVKDGPYFNDYRGMIGYSG